VVMNSLIISNPKFNAGYGWGYSFESGGKISLLILPDSCICRDCRDSVSNPGNYSTTFSWMSPLLTG
jgi:hypothetical protein